MGKLTIRRHLYEVVPANAAEAIFSRHHDGTIHFKNKDVTFSGNDVDRLLCDDAIIAFDWDGNLGVVQRLYKAAFNRVPDQDGLSANVAAIDAGLTKVDLANAFLASPEGLAKYPPDASDADYVRQLYKNVLNRLPENVEVDDWLQPQKPASSTSRGEVLMGFSDSIENRKRFENFTLVGVLLTRSFFGV